MCPARARRRASRASSSCRRTRRRSGRARRRSPPIAAVAEHLQDYPDGSATDLREAIGRAFGLDPARIVCGAGSDDLLNLLADAYLADGDEAIYTTHGFLVYPIATLGAGAQARRRAGERTTPPTSTRSSRKRERRAPRSCSSPIRTIRPAPMCRSTRSSGCTARCRRMCCWCSTPPMPNTCAATTTKPASSSSPPPRTS